MLATQTMMQLGVPLRRVLRRLRDVRQERYSSLRGFFPGATDQEADADAPILRTILLGPEAAASARRWRASTSPAMDVQVTAIRRKGAREINPAPETQLAAGDVLVLLGTQGRLARAEIRLLQG